MTFSNDELFLALVSLVRATRPAMLRQQLRALLRAASGRGAPRLRHSSDAASREGWRRPRRGWASHAIRRGVWRGVRRHRRADGE